MQVLDARQTAQALPYSRLVPAIAQAARELSEHLITAPERLVVSIDAASVLLCMPAIAADIGVTKLVTVHANNAAHGLPVIQGEVIVMDTATGRRLVMLDGPTVTARRTAAVTLLGIQTLMPSPPVTVLLIGTGTQAAAHADALVDFFSVTEFQICSRDRAKAQAFCDALRTRHAQVSAISVTMAELHASPTSADVVTALTTSATPVIPANLAAGTLAIGVGAFTPQMAEFPPALLHARRVVVDDRNGARHEAGDLLQAGIDWDLVADLATVLAEPKTTSRVAPVFKTVGQAAWDLAAARVALASLSAVA